MMAVLGWIASRGGGVWAWLGRLPRPVWVAVIAGAAMLGGWCWHDARVDAAFAAGGRAQAVADRARVEAAAAAAAAVQERLRAALAIRQAKISKGSDDALVARHADLERRHDDLRLRWAAHRAGASGAGPSGATAVSGAAGGAGDAACAAAGWVSFDIAAAAALAADAAIAKDDAWIAWVTAQAAAWPTAGEPGADGPAE